MQKETFVLMGLTDLAGIRHGGHLKIMLTEEEEQYLSALNVVVEVNWSRL